MLLGMTERRVAAVEGLYAAFGHVRRPSRVAGCPHCVAPDEDRTLLDRPLRSLTHRDLARYAVKALSTWGGAEEFRYFVPRLLELADVLDLPPVLFGKFRDAGWLGWPADERAAVEAFLAAWWADTLDRFPAEPDAAEILCCVGRAGADPWPYLERWGELTGVAAVRHLHAFVLYGVEWTRGPRLADAFWDRGSAAHVRVVEWLTGGRAAAAVEAAFAAETREDVLELLDQIHPALIAGAWSPGHTMRKSVPRSVQER